MTTTYFTGILFPLLLIALSGYIIWKSTNSFEVAADFLGRKMSHGVKGATINAVASSMPEFLTTMFFLFYVKDRNLFVDSFSGGLGVVAGSAVFNILIIPLAIILFGGILPGGKFNLNKKVLTRDGIFLIISNITLIIIIAQKEIKTGHGLILMLIYFAYLAFLRKGLGLNSPAIEHNEQFYIKKVTIKPRHFFFLDLKQIILNGRNLNKVNAWFTLIISTTVMSAGTWLLVEGTKLLGEDTYYAWPVFNKLLGISELHGLGIPIIFLSVLLAAAATSIPDTIISIKDARKGNHDDAISNAIGSNIFDISFAIGFPLMLYTLIHGGKFSMSEEVRLWSFGILIVMWFINTFVLLLFLQQRIPIRVKAILLLLIYILFILFIALEQRLDPSDILSRIIDRLN